MEAAFFRKNRTRAIRQLQGGSMVLSAYARLQRAGDMAHQFQQESNFWFLCGITEPDWLLIIDGARGHSTLVMPNISEIHRIFDGALSAEEAQSISGVDSVISYDEGQRLLQTMARSHSLMHTIGLPEQAEHFNFTCNPAIQKNLHQLERIFSSVQDCQRDLAVVRAIKQPEEITVMQKAINATIKAFEHVHTKMSTYKHEYEIETDFTTHIRLGGAKGHAYDPIVAAGSNACTLHYMKNETPVRTKQLVLMDIGASYSNYAADITRTYAKGQPSKRQAQVHSMVEQAHNKIIALLQPEVSVESYHKQVDLIMIESLKELGLYKNETSLRRYFPHAISHGLGIDVHDSLGRPSHLLPNMVLTVEPGIYIPEEKIGVRIEDDILITERGAKNLSGRLSTGW